MFIATPLTGREDRVLRDYVRVSIRQVNHRSRRVLRPINRVLIGKLKP